MGFNQIFATKKVLEAKPTTTMTRSKPRRTRRAYTV
uniref:Uncharacterized protein n=1 Tax=Rhizophora mucronata TaxID=61149 RepID=A0A2P2J647_RHIMU